MALVYTMVNGLPQYHTTKELTQSITLEQAREILDTPFEATGDEVSDTNAMRLRLVAIVAMDERFPAEYEQDRLDHLASTYEAEYPQ